MEYIRNPMSTYFRDNSTERRMSLKEMQDSGYDEVKAKDRSVQLFGKSMTAVYIVMLIFGVFLIVTRNSRYMPENFINPKISGYIYIAFAVAILVLAVVFVVNVIRRRKACSTIGTARCIGYDDAIFRKSGRYALGHYVASAPVYELVANGTTYQIYTGKYSSKESSFPNVGDEVEVRYDENDPCECIIKGDKSFVPDYVLFVVLFLMIIGIFAYSGYQQINYLKYDDYNRIIINKAYMQNDLGFSSKSIVSVYKRNVLSYEDSVLKLEPIPNATNEFCVENLDVSAGDSVYVFRIYNSETRILSCNQYYYDGEVIESRYEYTDDGRCILTNANLCGTYKANSVKVVSTTYLRESGGKYYFRDASGNEIFLDASSETTSRNYHVNEGYYFIVFDETSAEIFPQSEFCYQE